MAELHLIPDAENIIKTQKLAEEYHTVFEYNDFFHPELLDDKETLHKRISFYKGLQRNRTMDTLHGAFLDVCIHSSDSKIAEISKLRMRQSMEVAAELDCRAVVFHTNTIPGFEIPYYLEQWKEKNEQFMIELLREYDGIQIFMENMFDRSPDMLAALAKILSDEPGFGVCLDLAHAHVSGTSLPIWFEKLYPYIKHMHINDNDGVNDLHQAVGDGTVNWKEVQHLFESYKIQSSVLVEVSSYEAKEKSLQFMKQRGIYPFAGADNLRV